MRKQMRKQMPLPRAKVEIYDPPANQIDTEEAMAVFLSRDPAERETIIRWSQGDKERVITTDDPRTVRMLLKKYRPDRWYARGQLRFTVPARCLSFRTLEKRQVSDEQRQAMSDRAKAMVAARREAR